MKLSFKWINKRMGFFTVLAICMWLKTCFAYFVDFDLNIENLFQYFILLINPIATTLLLLSVALYVRRPKASYITMLAISFCMTLLLFSNAVYFREFSDFITINTMLGAGKVSSGLGESAIKLFRPYDLLYFLDYLILIPLLLTKKIKIDPRPVQARLAVAMTAVAAVTFSFNLLLAETSRPGLLKRTFSHNYIVKYLGINFFTGYNGYQTYVANQTRAQASPSDLVEVKDYVKEHYAEPNKDMFGIAKGRNVIYIHLESFQQFLIDYKLKDENGVEHEVTPFLNKLFHSQDTYSFDNFFHQVKSGKTSDAETLLEDSFFGLSQGPLFTQLGDKNTFQAAPAIFSQKGGYTTAVFHGNAGTFWNRNETYKRLGYNYFFDSSYYDVNDENSFQYGLHDKPFFHQSVQYLEHLQQPFYAKFISVSNHYPYSELKGAEGGFPLANTSDTTINGYFATANYLDQAIEEFFNYLKASGLYENSMIVLYGDHYGISNSRNPDLAPLLGKTKEEWNDFDNAEMQRTPLMFHIPGQTGGHVSHTYGGQVDVLPTLLHLVGIDTTSYIQLGQDLFSPKHEQLVAFRNGDFVSPDYYHIGGTIYDRATGQAIEEPDEALTELIKQKEENVDKQLSISDAITTGDLLRYYTDSGLKEVDPAKFNYKNQLDQILKIEKEKGPDSTSVFSQHQNQSTTSLYQTKTYQQYHEEKQP